MKFVYSAIVLMALEGARGFTSIAAKSPNTQLNLMIDGTKVGGEVKAANNFILVKVADAVEKSEGGILFADSAKVQKTQGTVVSVGPGKTHPETGEPFEIPVKAGEGLVYGKYDGTVIEIDGVKHSLIRDEDILVTFTGDELTLESANVIRDACLVYVEQKESESEGGLVLTKAANTENKQSTGKIVKVGPGLFGDMEVAPGDNIKFREYFGNEVELNGEEYSVVRMGDILAKF
jgi:chaperonin GroES